MGIAGWRPAHCSHSCSRSPPLPCPPAARRRRQLLEEAAGGGAAEPEWASDPIWQVAKAAAEAGMSEHGAPAGGGAAAAAHDDGDEGYEAYETAALWANFTAGGGSLAPIPSADDYAAWGGGGEGVGVRSLDVGGSSGDSEGGYEEEALQEPPEYDGSEGRLDARHRRAVHAANYSGAAWAGPEARHGGGGGGGRRLADAYFSGPAQGTILSWM